MNYKRHYDLLIEKTRQRILDKSVYTETHHIIPTCMGGLDIAENKVILLPEEHYIAHLLLAKIYDNHKLWYAVAMMTTKLCGRKNKMYAWARKKVNECYSIDNKNRWANKLGFKDYLDQCSIVYDEYVTLKNTVSYISKKYGMAVANVRRSLKHHADIFNLHDELKLTYKFHQSIVTTNTRLNFSSEQEASRILARKRTGYSTNQKGEARSGSKNPVYGMRWSHEKQECPHCLKIVAGKRWHFNNCKEKHENY